MPDFRLPKTAKNELLRKIAAEGLNPVEFDLQSIQDGENPYTRVVHKPTEFYFDFVYTVNYPGMAADLSAEWSPPSDGGSTHRLCSTREAQLNVFGGWLQTVKREAAAPDLWAALHSEVALVNAEVVEEDDRRFTANEREVLAERLEALRDFLIREAQPTPLQVEQINLHFHLATEASERLSKRDWKTLFVGAVMSAVVAAAARPDVIHATLQMAAKYVLPLISPGLYLPTP